jgi:uncharacterized protein YciI
MSYFVLEYRYADMDARARVRPVHLAYAKSLHDRGTIVLAGPVGDGSGAMMVLKLDSADEVAQIIKDDPYTAAGVGVDHVLRPWNVVVPAQSS